MSRPLVAIPARFAASTSALRFGAIVTARALSEAVLRSGGEPVIVHPGEETGAALAHRVAFADAVVLPGGGDLEPARYAQQTTSPAVYDVDAVQDEFDLGLANWALAAGVPLLAVCRGMQVVNVARGGSLEQDMSGRDHRTVLHEIRTCPGSTIEGLIGARATVSCYHHQRIDRTGEGLRVVASAVDGTVEAIEQTEGTGWFLGVQWHPEDTADSDPAQQALFGALVDAARH